MEHHSTVIRERRQRGVPRSTGSSESGSQSERDVGVLLDVHGAAQRLGVSVRFVRRLVEQRRVPFMKIGKFIRFDPATLDEWARSQSVEPV